MTLNCGARIGARAKRNAKQHKLSGIHVRCLAFTSKILVKLIQPGQQQPYCALAKICQSLEPGHSNLFSGHKTQCFDVTFVLCAVCKPAILQEAVHRFLNFLPACGLMFPDVFKILAGSIRIGDH